MVMSKQLSFLDKTQKKKEKGKKTSRYNRQFTEEEINTDDFRITKNDASMNQEPEEQKIEHDVIAPTLARLGLVNLCVLRNREDYARG